MVRFLFMLKWKKTAGKKWVSTAFQKGNTKTGEGGRKEERKEKKEKLALLRNWKLFSPQAQRKTTQEEKDEPELCRVENICSLNTQNQPYFEKEKKKKKNEKK